MPATAKELGVDPHNAQQNIHGAAKYLADLIVRYGSIPRALSAYNSGRPDAYLDPNFAKGQTYNYVHSILAKIGHPDALGAGGLAGSPAVGAGPTSNPGLPASPLSGLLAQVFNSNNETLGLPALNLDALTQAPPPAPAAPPGANGGLPAARTTQSSTRGSTVPFIEHYAQPFGLTVTSTTGGKHAPGSYHYRGRAVDFGGDANRMAALARAALTTGGWKELIYTGPGNPGYSILRGRVIPNSKLPRALFAEHTNHVHLAK